MPNTATATVSSEPSKPKSYKSPSNSISFDPEKVQNEFDDFIELSNTINKCSREGFEGVWFQFTDVYVKKLLFRYVTSQSKLNGKNSSQHLTYHHDDEYHAFLSDEYLEQDAINILSFALLSEYGDDNDVLEFAKFLSDKYVSFDDELETIGFAQYYAYLHTVLDENLMLVNKSSEHPSVMVPTNISVQTSMFSPPKIVVSGTINFMYGGGVVNAKTHWVIAMQESYDFQNLDIDSLDEEMVSEIVDERKKALELTKNFYTSVNGIGYRSNMFGDAVPCSINNERCIIDPEGLATINRGNFGNLMDIASISIDNTPEIKVYENLTDEDYLVLDSSIIFYSLKNKRWFVGDYSLCSPIKFRSNAFNDLILDKNKKRLLSAIVEKPNHEVTDFIDDKSGNGIILLHGEAGTGKTMTAESVAEMTKKPLYKVTLGELGTDVSDIEKNLTIHLTLSERWNAIILIDEADVFLEERSSDNLERNAIVTIFLRLLEYYSGIMFLTTNRVKYFDKAFTSRITLAIGYTRPDSFRMWRSLLDLSDINLSDDEVNKLCKFTLNGRQIKNAINSAKSLAHFDKVDVSVNHIEEYVNEVDQFVRGMNNES